MTTLVARQLQSSGTADFTVAEVNDGLTRSLAEYSDYKPHIVNITFDLEGRYGTDTTASASALTDTVKGQFLAADATNEKIVHNITRNTKAVILTQSSTAIVTIGSNLMTANDQYKIYNKQCWNQRQVYIGDVTNYQSIHSVEYPIGQRRNWKIYDSVLEVDVDSVPDSNSNTAIVSIPNNIQTLVRFNYPHALPNLTDWTATFGATATVSATSISATALQSAGTINQGTEFTIENHRTTYTVATSATIAANTVALTFFPALEAPVSSTAWVLTLRQSTLDPQDEEIIAKLAAGRIMESKANKFPNAISLGGGAVWQNFRVLGQSIVNESLTELKRKTPWRTSRRWPTE